MLAEWLAILHKKPAGTPLPWQRNEETFVLNGHPERPGSKFKPEWIYSYRPPLSERWRIRQRDALRRVRARGLQQRVRLRSSPPKTAT